MSVDVPPYFDALIAAFLSGHAGRNVHLGYWDYPPALSTPCEPGEFEAAQARLTELLVGQAGLADGQDVLDVGCGFGGVLEAIATGRKLRRVGVNIDPRQLEICRTLPLHEDNPLSLVAADACSLPFQAATFDRVFCIEAMFHFRSRAAFLQQAASVLRRGGRLVVSDILLRDPGVEAPIPAADFEAIIRSEYGPWPQPWAEAEEIVEIARQTRLELTSVTNATRKTVPSYRVTAPQSHGGFPERPNAGNLLRWMHVNGFASYFFFVYQKR